MVSLLARDCRAELFEARSEASFMLRHISLSAPAHLCGIFRPTELSARPPDLHSFGIVHAPGNGQYVTPDHPHTARCATLSRRARGQTSRYAMLVLIL